MYVLIMYVYYIYYYIHAIVEYWLFYKFIVYSFVMKFNPFEMQNVI